MTDMTREPQYQNCVEIRDGIGFQRFGLMSNQVWYDDPKRLVFMLSRYKFVAKLLSGKRNALEIGCADGFGSRIVRQEVPEVSALDFDPVFIADAKQAVCDKWPINFLVHDLVKGPFDGVFEAVYSLDVLEHIQPADEDAFLKNMLASLDDRGMAIIGMPSLESQTYASPPSKAGHVNCKSGLAFKSTMEKFFDNVIVFSMNDEVVHTGFYPMAHYILAVCTGKRPIA